MACAEEDCAKNLRTVEEYLELKRVELAALCKKHKPKPQYEISKLAARHKLKILFLPVSHPELNPIEMVWARMKDYIKKRNVNLSLTDVEKYANEFFDSFDANEWVKYIDHVKKVEEKYLSAADDIEIAI